jgi:hypothetical protein
MSRPSGSLHIITSSIYAFGKIGLLLKAFQLLDCRAFPGMDGHFLLQNCAEIILIQLEKVLSTRKLMTTWPPNTIVMKGNSTLGELLQ